MKAFAQETNTSFYSGTGILLAPETRKEEEIIKWLVKKKTPIQVIHKIFQDSASVQQKFTMHIGIHLEAMLDQDDKPGIVLL